MKIEIIRPRGQRRADGFVEPAIGRCYCGGEVVLYAAHGNGCNKCSREYNLVGQELHPKWRQMDIHGNIPGDY